MAEPAALPTDARTADLLMGVLRLQPFFPEFGSASAALAVLESGSIIGELALLHDDLRNATVTMLDQSVIFRLSFSDVKYTLAHNQELAAHLKSLAAQRLPG